MCDKYAAMRDLLGLADEGDPRRSRLREIARRWPGALREVEMVAPAEIERRAAAAEAFPVGSLRGDALSGPARAPLLWILVHARLREQLRSRSRRRNRSGAPGASASRFSYADFYASLADASQAEWPPPVAFAPAIQGVGTEMTALRSRHAYLAVAWASGLAMEQLMPLLLDREGHWDRRASDPGWSRTSSVG